jgi:hypothetical protein
MSQAAARSREQDESQERNLQEVAATSRQFAADMDRLTAKVNQLPAPAECYTLRQQYLTHLATIRELLLAISAASAKSLTDPVQAQQDLKGLQNTASPRALGDMAAADQALAEVCTRFRIQKDFKIDQGG